MISLQILNKVIQTQDISLIKQNNLDTSYFIGYEKEFEYIKDHYERYGKVPDKLTFLNMFKEFEFIEVNETDKYLIDALREENLYYRTVPVVQKVAELLKTNADDAVSYLLTELPNLKISYVIEGTDIIKQAEDRLKTYKEKLVTNTPWYFTTGFEELDDLIHGWSRGEELVVFFARTGQGKSWVLVKTLSHIWQTGFRVGMISPEMSPNKLGYRFDTLVGNFSNSGLIWGVKDKVDESHYEEYIKDISVKDGFIVATPADFQKVITVSKLKTFIENNKLDILGIDGIIYLTDERAKRGDNKTIALTNISEDLISLSNELNIPILVVVQANRSGVKGQEDEGTPDLETIRDSDGIAQNATKVISLRQKGAGIEFGIKKHRDGMTGGKLNYFWDIDRGEFKYIPSEEDAVRTQIREKRVEEAKKKFKDGKDVF